MSLFQKIAVLVIDKATGHVVFSDKTESKLFFTKEGGYEEITMSLVEEKILSSEVERLLAAIEESNLPSRVYLQESFTLAVGQHETSNDKGGNFITHRILH